MLFRSKPISIFNEVAIFRKSFCLVYSLFKVCPVKTNLYTKVIIQAKFSVVAPRFLSTINVVPAFVSEILKCDTPNESHD